MKYSIIRTRGAYIINDGKKFELEVKKSIPENVFYYRFKDGTANFSGSKNENVRFQARNMCDCLLYDSKNLYLLELKSHMGKSLPLSAIRPNQIIQLEKASHTKGVVAGFLINYRQLELTFFLGTEHVKDFENREKRRSIPVDYCIMHGIEIPGRKLRTSHRWDIQRLLNAKCRIV